MASGLKQVAASVKENVRRLKYGKQAVDWKGPVWEDLENSSMGFNTQELMISCGTVTVKDHPRHPQVLVIFNRELDIFQLPKGKKDINEALPTTAVRETVEETGVLVDPLYLKFGTRFTCPEGWRIRRSGELVPDTAQAEENEPEASVPRVMTKDIIYSSAYVDPATQSFRYLFWYAATPTGDSVPDNALRKAEDIGRLQPLWFPVEKAICLLKMTVEKQAVATVRDYIKNMTPQDWELSCTLSAQDKQATCGKPPSPEHARSVRAMDPTASVRDTNTMLGYGCVGG